ncbi:unnamed protein product [Spirodela intermedia]|uniref:Uncharacterized protein n=1 Tax=Spirodela intermedia TaxID=51605 RepID=A0A7I8JPW0_SPIIN|nr:unnamed protein product [Spirodela intermedia]CAA6672186.1 unnamed protein product [Spirodela intermedia]
MTPARKLRLPPPIFFPPPPPPPPPAAVSPLETVTDRITKLINEHPFPSRPSFPSSTAISGRPSSRRSLSRPSSSASSVAKPTASSPWSSSDSPFAATSGRASAPSTPPSTRWPAPANWSARGSSWRRRRRRSPLCSAASPWGSYSPSTPSSGPSRRPWRPSRGWRRSSWGGSSGWTSSTSCSGRSARGGKCWRRAPSSGGSTRGSPEFADDEHSASGFKETGNLMAMDMFFHEMILRGFAPDVVTFNIRIDGYCKKGRIREAMRFLQEMEEKNCSPTLETMTTLVHGAGVAKDASLARRLFDEMPARYLTHDAGAYNALMAALVRGRTRAEGDRPRRRDLPHRPLGTDGRRAAAAAGDEVCGLYRRMVEKNFVPATRTVVALMKFFCENRRVDFGLLPSWACAGSAGDALCCRGRVEEACSCFKEVVERGRRPPERSFEWWKVPPRQRWRARGWRS